MPVAERHADVRLGLFVLLERQPVVGPCRVAHSVHLQDMSEVGIVDGLSQGTSQAGLTGQCQSEQAVGGLVVVERQIDIAQSVERGYPIFARYEAGVVAEGGGHVECPLVIFCGLVEDAQPAEVGAQLVEGLHDVDGVFQLFSNVKAFLVIADGLFELAVIATFLAQVVILLDGFAERGTLFLGNVGIGILAARGHQQQAAEQSRQWQGYVSVEKHRCRGLMFNRQKDWAS